MRQHIKNFVDAVRDKASTINPAYRRNFRELIKVIPAVGSWIDSITMGALEDAILAERLDNLDAACARAMTLDDGELLYAEITNINSICFVILLTNLSQITAQTQEISSNLGHLISLVEAQTNQFQPHPKFRLVTISGPSAVGKDCILDLILHRKDKAQTPVDALTKFTTRQKRIVDSKYYDFVSETEFDLLERSGTLIFPYFKRGARYGFDRTHLFNAAREEHVLFSVFTHFESLPADRQFLRNQGIHHLAILLNADKETLVVRSEGRVLAPDDIERRKDSIEHDLLFLRENENYLKNCFDLMVDNGDAHAKYETHDHIVQLAGLREMAFVPMRGQNGVE